MPCPLARSSCEPLSHPHRSPGQIADRLDLTRNPEGVTDTPFEAEPEPSQLRPFLGDWSPHEPHKEHRGPRPSWPRVPGRPDDAQIDHIEPLSAGGHGGAHNGAVACKRCNRDKSTKPVEVWDDELRDLLDD